MKRNSINVILLSIALSSLLSFSSYATAVPERSDSTKFVTFCEASDFQKTPRYRETMDYCRILDQSSSKISLTSIGLTPQGREIPLLILDKDGFTSPDAIRKAGRSVILAEASIHAGEPDGKDAGLMLIRDIAIFDKYPRILDSVSLLFIPIVNPDGHEDFGAHYRINQNGPDEVGARFTAQRYNMNRDFIKADAPETEALLELYNHWLPELFIDIHVTNGADFQYVSTYGLDHSGYLSMPLHQWSREVYEKELLLKMEKSGYPVFPYLEYTSYKDSTSLLVPSTFAPQYSNGYAYANNRLGILVENHIYKPYKERIRAAYLMMLHSLEIIGANSSQIQDMITQTELCSAALYQKEKQLPLSASPDRNKTETTDFLAWQTKTVISDLSGAEWTYSNRNSPVTYKMEVVNSYIAQDLIDLPKAYIVSQEQIETIKLLDLHKIEYSRLERDTTMELTTYRFHNPEWSERPYEGRITLNTDYSAQKERVDLFKGDVMISSEQPKIKIVAHMLEPQSSTSLVYWGFFNSFVAPPTEFWIRLGYMEEKGRELLAKDAELKKEFETKKENDKEFASNPQAILQFFMDKVRADVELNSDRYPVYKLE
jgi:murein tripeptide amidase MpaA